MFSQERIPSTWLLRPNRHSSSSLDSGGSKGAGLGPKSTMEGFKLLPWVHGAGSESRSHSDFLSLFQVLASFPLSRWKQVFHAIPSTLSLPGPSGHRSAPHYQWIQRGRTQSQTPPEEEINENIWIWTLEDTALLPSPAKSEGVSQAHLRQTLQQSTLCSTLCPAGPTPRLPLQLSPQAQSITLHSGRWKHKHIFKME